ncbi:MAG TPA: transmembrane repetitive protein [Stenotrophomonas sp.]|nr:transmembrane repetitive protein [Stenotrophomonas sp.]
MTKAADLIQALLARKPVGPLLDRRSGLPFAWGHWARTRDVVATVAYPSRALADVVAQRPPRPSTGVAPRLSSWQAFRRLWWQQWEPRPRDEAPYHWLSVLASFLIHLCFFLLLLWVAVVRWAQPPEEGGEAGRVKLEMIGRGSPAETGGGPGEPDAGGAAAPAPAPARPATSSRSTPANTAAAASTPPPATASAEANDSEVATEPVTAPPMTVPTPRVLEPVIAEQTLQVTETPVPTTDFVLPPPQPVELAVPTPREVPPPPVEVRERQVVVAERPQLVAPRVREIDAPSLRQATPQVREREVVTVDTPQITVPAPQAREVPAPQMRAPEVQVRQIEVPVVADASAAAATSTQAENALPAPSQAPSTSSAAVDAKATAAAPSAAAANARAGAAPSPTTAGTGTRASERPAGNAAASGSSGPRAADRSGGWDTAVRGDDWSVGQRDRAGDDLAGTSQGSGLYNRDGSLRVPAEGQGTAVGEGTRGAPGSDSDSWSRERIASSGTWLKRPPYDYSPTSFDQYWVPNESLLAEWVRKGIKQIEIPIPGTNTRIRCNVSLLNANLGSCGLTNPNMNEQPAQARPPPDVPFKKELQEDNGSVR